MAEAPTRARPRGVALLALWNAFLGVAAFVAATVAYVVRWLPTLLYATFWDKLAALVGIAAAVMGVQLLAAYGLWTLRPWGRYLEYGLAAAGIAAGMLSLPFGAIGVMLSSATWWYLSDARIRGYFRAPKAKRRV